MDWDKLKIFHTVAEASSFTKASTILNLDNILFKNISSLDLSFGSSVILFSFDFNSIYN